MFPLPRVVYAMADDGLIFKSLASINEKTQTPVIATISMASLAAILAAIFDLKELVDFMSIGTLMAYTLVAASVMILRYRKEFVSFQPGPSYHDHLRPNKKAYKRSIRNSSKHCF